jgi:DNA-binding transcriptional regulator YiaG
MANIASVLKEEITRLARKELRSETENLKKASAQYRSEIAALKRRTAILEQQVSRLGKTISQNAEIKTTPEVKTKVRFTAKGFKSLRQRLGLTAEVIGALLDVSAQTIYSWEAGNSSPREQQMAKIAMLRGMGKREVTAILNNLTE